MEQLNDPLLVDNLQRLANVSGTNTQFLPEVSVVRVVADNHEESQLVTIMRNNARTNITSLFAKKKTPTSRRKYDHRFERDCWQLS